MVYAINLLTLCMLAVCMLFCRLLIFSKLTFSKNSFGNTPLECQNSLDPDQARHFVGPDLDLDCSQRLSADDSIANRQKINDVGVKLVNVVWEKERCRPDCAFVQSGYHIGYSLSKRILY